MSNERDERDDAPPLAVSRRRFLQGTAGFAAASVASLMAGPAATEVAGQGRQALTEDCDCGFEAAVPLLAAAMFLGEYVGLAASESGPRLFPLNIDGAQRVSLGLPLKVDLPEGFIFGSLGIARGHLVLSGGLPFVWESFEVDDEMSDDVRAAMDTIPEGTPTSGSRHIDVMGVQPAVFLVEPPSAVPIQLPELPMMAFATATAVTETASGSLVVLIEHCNDLNESYYAAAVDVIEEQAGQWDVWSAGLDLGESGPNYLAVDHDDLVVGLNSFQGAMLVWPKRELSPTVEGAPAIGRILALVPSTAGLAVMAEDRDGVVTQWPGGGPSRSFTDGTQVQMDSDEIVGAVAVAGTKGQVILLGRQSALLVDENSAFMVPHIRR